MPAVTPNPRKAEEVAQYLVQGGLTDPNVLEGDLGLKHFGPHDVTDPRNRNRSRTVDHGLRPENQDAVIHHVRKLLRDQ